ncbi:MAG: pilus (MSHA type) biogenesis protein MshL [Steroidobacteraceae bacterium]
MTAAAIAAARAAVPAPASRRARVGLRHELEESLRALIGRQGGREVVANPQSGVIAVRATPRELRSVQEYLDRIQDVVTRQVVLEAKIIEVELADGAQSGINWAVVSSNASRTISGFQRGPQQGFGPNILDQPGGSTNLGPGNPLRSLVGNTLGGAFTLAIDTADFSAFIELLKTQGRTRVLSSPRVSTLNNQKAVIKAGTDEFFVTNVSSNTVVGTSSATNRDVELTPFFSGIALDVTPQVSAEGGVILHIHPTVSEVTERIKSLKVAGSTDELPLAFSEVRESDSVVKAKSGQVIVIGGLMRNTRRAQGYRTPVLGDIPGVGNLFRSQRKSEIKSELVILLRPVVVERDEQWGELVQGPLDRAVKLDPKAPVAVP